MKNILLAAAAFAPIAAADTYITYDDGGVYTLGENESVYVADRDVFIKRTPASGDVNFVKQEPFTGRDYEEPVVFTPTAQIGSHGWCLDFEPWANGLTFDQISFNYACDTNRDNKYGCGDTQFDESGDGDVCASS
jgi:hypothetical protein